MVFGRLFCINFMYTCEEKYYIHSSEGQIKDKKFYGQMKFIDHMT